MLLFDCAVLGSGAERIDYRHGVRESDGVREGLALVFLRRRAARCLSGALGTIATGAYAAEWLVIRFFTRPRTPPVEDDDEGVAQRAVHLIQRTLIDLAPVGAFALCGYAALAVAALALVAWEMLGTLVERYLEERDEQGELVERGARIRTFLPLVRNVVRIVLLVLVTLVVLSELGVDIGPLLAGAGIVGLAVSFGAQCLVKDVIAGFFILLEDTISVGDVVELGGRAGVVESMSIRSIRMRDLRGHVHTVPFGEVATVLNMTKDYSYAFIEAGVAYRENVDDVVEVLRAVGDDMQADEEFGAEILEPLEVLGLDSFGASSVNIRVRLKTVPMKQWAVRREFQRRMKRAFDERGIEIPFPHQTVYFGVDKSGRAPSARIALENETRGDGDAASATPPEYSDSEFERLASLGAESGQPIRPERK